MTLEHPWCHINANAWWLKFRPVKICLIFVFQGSRDNMSIIIIAFPGAPKVDPEALRKEEELNKLIKQKVTGDFI